MRKKEEFIGKYRTGKKNNQLEHIRKIEQLSLKLSGLNNMEDVTKKRYYKMKASFKEILQNKKK